MLAAIEARPTWHQKPWILDPVAVGGLTYRTEFANHLLSLQPAVIRGNASEIIALSGLQLPVDVVLIVQMTRWMPCLQRKRISAANGRYRCSNRRC
jgi:hypothetical protein